MGDQGFYGMDSRKTMNYSTRLFLVLIVLCGLFLRFRGIENPLLDDQAWRQTDTAGMALHMEGRLNKIPDVFFPRLSYDGVTAQKVELEFPLFPYLLAWTWSFVGQADLWGRLWAIGFSVVSILGLYVLGRNLFSEKMGLITAAVYTVLPLAVYYGRVIMPEPLAQALSIWALNSMIWWRRTPSTLRLLIAGLVMGAAILAKLPQIMIFPVAIMLGFLDLPGNKRIDLRKALIYSVLAIVLPASYYISAHLGSTNSGQFVSGIISTQVVHGSTLYWNQLQKNIEEGLSYIVLAFASLGLVKLFFNFISTKSDIKLRVVSSALILWTVICVLYVLIICTRIPLDYYLVPILPLAAILVGVFLESLGRLERLTVQIVTIVLIIWLMRKGYSDLTKKYAWDDQYLIQADWIRSNTSQGSVLILSDPPPMTFYYSRRVGFRLIGSDDDSIQRVNELPGNYLVKLPHSVRTQEFWQRINASYEEIGPGIYKLD